MWTEEEHDKFLEAVKLYPQGPWKALATFIGTRTARQVQTHAVKYQEKISRRARGLRKIRRQVVRAEHRIDEELAQHFGWINDDGETTPPSTSEEMTLEWGSSTSAAAASEPDAELPLDQDEELDCEELLSWLAKVDGYKSHAGNAETGLQSDTDAALEYLMNLCDSLQELSP